MRTESRIRTETCNNKTRNLAPLKFPLVRGIAKSGYCVIDFQEFPNGKRQMSSLFQERFSIAPRGRIHFPARSLPLLRYLEHRPGMVHRWKGEKNPRDNAPRRHTVKHRPPTTNRTPQSRVGVVANDGNDNDDDNDDDDDYDDEEVEG
uniref:Uncharacterized protein n=1 Tax=Vespula pensylvanica TaxID=30213 RepID=A0A834PA22_VESPE|nr:hypothetical protein H0235_002413 [Vespula pensylvanica]